MSYFYSLRIDSSEDKYDEISKILGVGIVDYKLGWQLEVNLNNEGNRDVIAEFLNLLKDRYSELNQIGVKQDDISIWLIYEYKGQCNLEFEPEILKKMGENGIRLCLSCYNED